ncbi:hypothetical protein CHGG_04570 [Chaetomium globosum CBS 148.51]|uniref:HNH nuclease domain-containing protein n=1 Tax=Chaetomium globosum (strain ATCC 6205 / CBS 148.51 / DSM 1962 / NBRC 6347 / NRRL 1970) TaxID=306901 RepID=Q2H0X6_CHAGB|nr:uncharacterized protein CHGG_04570 [Chaetomium globosum CBS 148.51]EAQ87951.1 hypothetical protein CHGG_04570 [Chaetomium globosum CBS 148.51]
MFRYALWSDCVTTDDPLDVVLLRSDIHALFDARRFFLGAQERGVGQPRLVWEPQ